MADRWRSQDSRPRFGRETAHNHPYDHQADPSRRHYNPRGEYSHRPPTGPRHAPEQRQYHQNPAEPGYSFRGVANNDRHIFSFRSKGPPAPSFSAANLAERGEPLQKRATLDRPRNTYNDRPRQARRPDKRRFVPRPAHERAILRVADRETTPEQLSGMNNAQPRFRALDEIDFEADDAATTKQQLARLQQNAPRWSNPDPYTALPPVVSEADAAPKQDIVNVIRKAKRAAADHAVDEKNTVGHNDDFISFDVDVDDDDDDASSSSDGRVSINLPKTQAEDFMFSDHKRKRTPDESASSICPNWRPRDGVDPTPWYDASEDRDIDSDPGQRLHEEICDFYEYVRPQPWEDDVRLDLIDRIQAVVDDFKFTMLVEVHAFGSFASGLYLPTADMDLVVLSQGFLRGEGTFIGQDAGQIRNLAKHIRHSGIASHRDFATIVGARVPLIKFTDELTGIKVDLSFENPSGLHAVPLFRSWRNQFPAMPILVSVIKQLLAMREQNEVHTGGFGGFTIICLVVSMLQLLPEPQEGEEPPHFGLLLQRFLHLYGEDFDVESTGITIYPAGYYDKTKLQIAKANPERLTIVDPMNDANDISGGSRNVLAIFDIFRTVRNSIQARLDDFKEDRHSTGSILGCALAGDYSHFVQQRKWMSDVWDDLERRDVEPKFKPLPNLTKLPLVVTSSLRKIAKATGTRGWAKKKSYGMKSRGRGRRDDRS